MADERTYGFSRDDASDLVNLIGSRENWYPEIKPRGGRGSGKACGDVRFQILVADPLTRTALCVITARPYGCSWSDIPATIFDMQAIEVCDPGGCFFNEPNAKMIGREGWAKYMQPIGGASWCQGKRPYYGTQPEWEVYSLCCAVDSCKL
jgi:hypothetical protein